MISRAKLFGLAVGAFAIGTESYVIAGLLPDLAKDLGVSLSMAGQLITVFALAYAIGSPLLAVATGRMERRQVLLGSLAVFAVFNVVAAFAHSYAVLMMARLGMAAAAATFMPAASAYAVAITPVAHRGKALAIIYTGLTVATVIGVPTGVLIGEHFGWRYSFVIVAGLAVIAFAGMAVSLAKVRSDTLATLADRVEIARRPEVLGALVVTVLTLTGAFSIYSYLAPFLQQTSQITGTALAVVLFLFGAGSAVGNLLSGSASDRLGPTRIVNLVLGALIALFVVLSLAGTMLPPATARWIIIPTIAVWGFVGWSFPAAQQARLVAIDPRLASITLSLNASAIYFGVSLGALVGSFVVKHAPIATVGWFGAACEITALILMRTWIPRTRRSRVVRQMDSPALGHFSEEQPQHS
jgi:predicted MFS family arabinose efflux permease